MTDDQIRNAAEKWVYPVEELEKIPEGNLNEVWRARGANHSCIIKHAPPHVATQPEMPLSQHRAMIEARALQELSPEGRLRDIPTDQVKVPTLWEFDERESLLVMEDVNEEGSLGEIIRGGHATDAYLAPLARFIGRLHASTYDTPWIADYFDNTPMQKTRLEVQYTPVGEQLREAGVQEAELLGERAAELGEELLKQGRCLIMGDLWPPSVLKAGDTQYLIDWELAHYGRPLQDIAHMSAHLWMYSRAYDISPWSLVNAFIDHYLKALGDKKESLWNEREWKGFKIHMGCEIVMRILGTFSGSYLEGIYKQEPYRSDGLETAVRLIGGRTTVKFE